jgi:hypothetical protein
MCTGIKIDNKTLLVMCGQAKQTLEEVKESRCTKWIQEKIDSERNWWGWVPFRRISTHEDWVRALGKDCGNRPVCWWSYPDWKFDFEIKEVKSIERLARAPGDTFLSKDDYDFLTMWACGGPL